MFDRDVFHPDLDGVQALRNSGVLLACSNGRHSRCYRLVESFRRDVDRVGYALHILNHHFARANGHGRNLP